jgi:hypothetical protein
LKYIRHTHLLGWEPPRIMHGLLVRGGAVWQLVGLITRRSQVQILPPLPQYLPSDHAPSDSGRYGRIRPPLPFYARALPTTLNYSRRRGMHHNPKKMVAPGSEAEIYGSGSKSKPTSRAGWTFSFSMRSLVGLEST